MTFRTWSRILTAVLLALVGAPRAASADTILHTGSDESFVLYGDSGAMHNGSPLFFFLDLEIDGVYHALDWSAEYGTSFLATSGPLLSKTEGTNAHGDATTTYRYSGGSIDMEFGLRNMATGEIVTGGFSAPILSMTLKVTEFPDPFDGPGDSVELFYRFGTAALDPAVAAALGVSPNVLGGHVVDNGLLFGTGDHATPDRLASEGTPVVAIRVPEPGALLLMAVSGVGLFARARSRAKRS
jgi:hypothetical protein